MKTTMKTTVFIMMLLLMVGCSSKNKPIEQPDDSHIVETDKVEEIGDVFTSDDFIRIIDNQCKTAENWTAWAGSPYMGERGFESINSVASCEIVHDSIKSKKDLRNYLLDYYTEEYVENFFKEPCTYIEYDGKLYTTSPGRFSIGPTYETITITKTSDNSYSISLKYDRSIDPNSEYIRTFNYVKEGDIWVFDDMVAGLYDINNFECTYEDENVIVLLYKGSLGSLTVKNDVTINLRNEPSKAGYKIGTSVSGDDWYYYGIKENEGYTWYQVSPDGGCWLADNGEWLTIK